MNEFGQAETLAKEQSWVDAIQKQKGGNIDAIKGLQCRKTNTDEERNTNTIYKKVISSRWLDK